MRLLRRTHQGEGGFSVAELLIAMTLMLIVLDATLMAFSRFETTSRIATVRNDSQDRLRTATDRLARDLRNIAGSNFTQSAIDRATAYDLMFLSVDPTGPSSGQNAANVRRVRYCLDASNPANEVLWMQVQTWTSSAPPSPPSTGLCPDPSWGNQRDYADYITNQNAGQNRPAFSYNSGTPAAIATVHADFVVNVNQGNGPPRETELSTGVFLRNQTLPPVASFTATPQSNYRVVLNGSTSYDPGGQALTYVWYDGATKVGTGITFTYQGATGGAHVLALKAFDPAGLEGDSPTQTVTLAP
jgi:hypothetical protein